MRPRIILDTGPLVAFLHAGDRFHAWARQQFDTLPAPFLTCEPVIAESCHLLCRVPGGPDKIMELVARRAVQIDLALSTELTSVAHLFRRYRDRPISLADACLVRMTEIFDPSVVLTLDANFLIYRRFGRRTIPVLHPDSH
ncbi:MAG: hypothetical protein V2J42_06510 [Wenzhouxiangella sp.]|jgi:predicted nucleic acid-binding protein|nr:hypothetical protein [Wenzhouxiangella sp.]